MSEWNGESGDLRPYSARAESVEDIYTIAFNKWLSQNTGLVLPLMRSILQDAFDAGILWERERSK